MCACTTSVEAIHVLNKYHRCTLAVCRPRRQRGGLGERGAQLLFPPDTAEPVKSLATKGMTDTTPVLESALSVPECAVRRIVGPVRQVGQVRQNWCATAVDRGLAVCLAGWCGAPPLEMGGNHSQLDGMTDSPAPLLDDGLIVPECAVRFSRAFISPRRYCREFLLQRRPERNPLQLPSG